MRIGIITGEYPPMQGGVGAYSQILAGELARQGHTIHVLSRVETNEDNAAVQLANTVQSWGAGSLQTVNRWAQDNHLDILNLQFQTAAFGMSPWIHFLPDVVRQMPVVTTFHDLRYPYLFPKAGMLRDWIVNHLAKASAGIIVTNHEDLHRLQALPRTTLIPIGSNILKSLPGDFDARTWRTEAGVESNDFLLAYFGLLNRSKGFETLLQAFARLRQDGVPVRLVIIGGGAGSSDPTNAAFIDEINMLITRLNLAPFIHQTGYLDEESVGAYLSASDGVVLPFLDGASYRRGSLMAAIHYGCAIVTTMPQVMIPTFKHGDNMLLVPPGDNPALENAIRQLQQSPNLGQHLRQGASELADTFRWDTIARDYTAFFTHINEGR